MPLSKTEDQAAMAWVNERRAEMDLPPITEWPKNEPRAQPMTVQNSRRYTCPVAQALPGWGIGVYFADASQNAIELPEAVIERIAAFDDEIS